MWPTLISLGPISIHSFGVLVFLGVWFGGFKLWRRAKEEGWDETTIMDIWLLSGVAALIGGRAGFIFSHWPLFGGSWYKMIFLTKWPGLSGAGAWLAGAGTLLILALFKRLNFKHFAEAAVPALILAEIFIRLGSFLAIPGVAGRRFPVALFWALGLGVIYLLINRWEQRYRGWGWKEGILAPVYLLLLGILGLGLSFLEDGPAFLAWWGAGQALAGGLILLLLSGIKIKAPLKFNPAKRKKRGFDYV